MKRLQDLYASATNSLSMTSLGACVLSASLLSAGHVFWHFQHDFTLLLWYFCCSAATMVIYAVAIKLYAANVPSFDGGLLHARMVIRLIGWTTALSFLWCGADQLTSPTDDSIHAAICLAAGPGVMALFALTYGFYATDVLNDFKHDRTARGASVRKGTGRSTMRLIKVASFLALGYCVFHAVWALDAWLLLECLIGFGLSLLVCTLIEAIFIKSVTLAQDRGVHAVTEVEVSPTPISAERA
jgi:hypothetical protein